MANLRTYRSNRKPGAALLIPSAMLDDNQLRDLIGTMESVKAEILRDDVTTDVSDIRKAIRDCRDELDWRGVTF